MSEKILFVDDDRNLLAACERNFRRLFPLETAEGGEAGLAKIAERGPFAVVVADRQMPGMDGVQFLAEVRKRAPDTVRMMLTGNADLEVAIKVVNEGNIFRFLTKPCPHEVLAKAIEDARAQHRLIIAERELLNRTLSGSIKVLTDILSSVDPKSFGRAEKLRSLITEVTERVPIENAWEVHLAAMLGPVAYVTLPPETVMKARSAQPLSKAEEDLMIRVPEIASRLLAHIPRLEGVAKIVRYQRKNFDGTGFPQDDVKGNDIPAGARLLRIMADFAELTSAGNAAAAALVQLAGRHGRYDPALLAVVSARFGGPPRAAEPAKASTSLTVNDLKVGMVLASDVYTKDGVLVLAAGHRINEMTLESIKNFNYVSGVKEPIVIEGAEK